MQNKSRKEYLKDYKKVNYRSIPLTLHKIKDKKIIEHLDKLKSKSSYIKKLIKEDMARLTRIG